MFDQIKKRFQDLSTIKALCEQAENYALQDDQREPGAEHFVLSAIDLPDGTAKLAFAKVGIDALSFKSAIQSQYRNALRSVGVEPHVIDESVRETEALGERRGVYTAAASGKDLMQALAAARKSHAPLLGAHVISAVADMEQGVSARALGVMGVDRVSLKRAAEDVMGDFSTV